MRRAVVFLLVGLCILCGCVGEKRPPTDAEIDQFFAAAENGNLETLKNLLSKRAKWELLRARDREGMDATPLHWAASSGHTDIAEFLISEGADLTAMSAYGETPLHWAARERRFKVAELLIAKGADVNARNNMRETPMHWSAQKGDAATTRLLLANGADPNAKDQDGWGVLDWALASAESTQEVVAILRQCGAKATLDNPPRDYAPSPPPIPP